MGKEEVVVDWSAANEPIANWTLSGWARVCVCVCVCVCVGAANGD